MHPLSLDLANLEFLSDFVKKRTDFDVSAFWIFRRVVLHPSVCVLLGFVSGEQVCVVQRAVLMRLHSTRDGNLMDNCERVVEAFGILAWSGFDFRCTFRILCVSTMLVAFLSLGRLIEVSR